MGESPFPYQGPLEPGHVHGRDALVEDLIGRVRARRLTALLGPRRYGKTSMLREVAARCSELTTVWIDLYEVTSTDRHDHRRRLRQHRPQPGGRGAGGRQLHRWPPATSDAAR